MLFNSPEFIFGFLPVTLAGFFALLFLRGKWGVGPAFAWVTAASFFFYAWWEPEYLLLFFVSIAFNFAVGRAVGPAPDGSRPGRRGLLAAGVAANLVLLGWYKYAAFAVGTANAVAGTSWALPRMILPLAISFYTFLQIAYLVDAYRGQARQYSFFDYCLWVAFFPHLIAGPLVHHNELLPQFRDPAYRVRAADLSVGLTLFVIGLSKKVLVADVVARHANPVFDAAALGSPLTFFDAWTGALAYTLQLYFDFSGYSDMAIGLSKLFGVALPVNFDSPYKSRSISEFWRRWHITLSRFLRDYLYIPLGGSRKGRPRRYLNLMTTMLLGGLWHGAGWTFVFWGGLHGSYLVANHAWEGFRARHPRVPALPGPVAQGLTLLAVVVGWVFFRATSWGAATGVLAAMSGAHGVSVPPVLERWLAGAPGLVFGGLGATTSAASMAVIVGAGALALFAPNSQELTARYAPVLDRVRETRAAWAPRVAVGVGVGVLFFWVAKTFFTSAPSEFLYFNF